MDLLKNHIFETVVTSVLAIVPIFVKKTLNGYDKRLNKSDEVSELILRKLHKIDKEVTRVATIIEMKLNNKKD